MAFMIDLPMLHALKADPDPLWPPILHPPPGRGMLGTFFLGTVYWLALA
jgi:hypothetical protein